MTDAPRAGGEPAARSGTGRILVVDQAALLPAAWDGLVHASDGHLSTKWLRVAEATAGVRMRYLLHCRSGEAGGAGDGGEAGGAGDGDELDGALATALAMPDSPWLFGRPDSVLELAALEGLPGAPECLAELTGGRATARTVAEMTRALSQESPDAPATSALMPSLLCGGRHIGVNRVLTRDDDDGADGVISDLVTRAEELAGEVGARSIAFLYVHENDLLLRRVLGERGYLACVSASLASLTLPEGGFGAYRAMLPKKRRQSIAHERRQLAEAGFEASLEPLTDDLIKTLAVMESQLFAKHGGAWTPEQSESALHAVRAELGSDAFVFAGRLDGELCGFNLIFRFRDHWFDHRAGFDYERVGELPVYFELAYNSPIEAASESGARALHHGIGAQRTKELRGFTLFDSFLYVKPILGR